MIIVGAGGLAKEILSIVQEQYSDRDIYFFDNVNEFSSPYIFSKFKILSTQEELLDVFENTGYEYVVGVGGIENKIKLTEYFNSLGGRLKTLVSKYSFVGKYEVSIGKGSILFPGVKVSNNVFLGSNCLVYYNCILTHDCVIGDNAEIAPGVSVLGGVKIENNVWIGSNSTILPKLKIGSDSIIGAGAVVTKDVEKRQIVYGVPAKSK